ncbi:ATP-binding protein [Methylobacterium currus]|uniref:ATP-binding protein n=1 Tax=Methylobacterium currus TaxID=2051553 RepID=UPI001E5AE5EA|nr:ATP-binding protein [Methylobacterium currus]UHC17638.1 ATP-binding protein [Methylobacterium currus]
MNAEPQKSERRWAELEKALAHVETWLAPEVERVARGFEGGQAGAFHGLVMGPDEARRALSDERRSRIPVDRAAAAKDLPEQTRLATLCGADAFDACVLLLALAPEVSSRFGRIYAFLQDDLARTRPTFDLVLNLIARDPAERLALRRRFAPDAPLIAERMIQTWGEPGGHWLTTQITLDAQILRLLTGDSGIDERLAGFVRLAPGTARAGTDDDSAAAAGASASLVRARRVWFDGPDSFAKRRAAAEAARLAGMPLIEIDETAIPADRPPAQIAALLVREAALRDAALFLDGLEDEDSREPCPFCTAFLAEAERKGAIAFLAGKQAWLRDGWAARGLARVAVPRPDASARQAIWTTSLAAHDLGLTADQIHVLARRYRLTGRQIETAAAVAAAAEPDARPDAASPNAAYRRVVAATRAQTGQRIGALAARRPPRARWEDLILPEDALRQLRELCRRVELRDSVLARWGERHRAGSARGVHALFAGSSGTGKTMAAEIVAGELGLDLFRISLPNTVSKYIGETEKNLDRIFDAAEDSNAILFFDEADAILGKRSEVRDSHDRYANLEISYLLQRMEEFDGVSILASNLRANIDDAFTRRLAFVIHFPFPDAAHRRRIWEGAWPDPDRRPRDVDLDRLASQFKLSGGSISNIAVAASFLAAEREQDVATGDVVTALRREFQKLGKPAAEQELRDSLTAGVA